MQRKRLSKLIIMMLISTFILSGWTSAVSSLDQKAVEVTELATKQESNQVLEDSVEYLEEFFNVSFAEEVTKDDINNALKKVFGEETELIDGRLSGFTFIKAINKAAGFNELTQTYDNEKVKKSFKQNGVDINVVHDVAKYVASTLDTNLLNVDIVKELVQTNKVTQELAIKSFMEVINNSSLGRNYLGYSNDPTIYRKIEDSWDSFVLFDDETLTDIGAKLVENEKITGYNLKLNSYNPDFISKKTMSYGHSNIEHALQLIGLLNSENLVAKVQLEPKVSIYEYLLEWGPVGEPSSKYEVIKVGDLLLANSVEYDLNFEFSSTEDLIAFEQMIEKYAKKNEENQGNGLIVASWWQPFMLVTNEEMPKDLFFEVYDMSLSNDEYTLRSVVLKENKDNIENELKESGDSAKVQIEKKYTNKAFHSYLQGTDHE